MSRNEREGKYYGWVKGRHLRWHYPHKVSSWLAFRLHTDRKHARPPRHRTEGLTP